MTEGSTLERKRFSRLSQAVDFIASCLERDDCQALFGELEDAREHLAWDPDYMDYFSRYVFQPLSAIHGKTDLRVLYGARTFPEGETAFKLGGHMQELGCIHIDFEVGERDWFLRDIWLCR